MPSPHPKRSCVRIEAFNRGPEAAALDILPQLWFRNTWAWGAAPNVEPLIRQGPEGPDGPCLVADDSVVARPGDRSLRLSPGPAPSMRNRAARCFSPTTRPTARASSGRATSATEAVRQGRVSSVYHERRGLHQPRGAGHQGRNSLPLRRHRARGFGRRPVAPLRSGGPVGRRSRRSMPSSQSARPRPTSSLPKSSPAGPAPTSA